jgi:DNA-binding NtrC family response regulator
MEEKHNILVVDDNEKLCENLCDILELKGYDTYKAYDGYHAIECINNTNFSIVIMDIKMPGINGLDALKILKRLTPNTSFIMITAFADDLFYKENFTEEDLKIVQKPIDIDKLLLIIEDTIKNKDIDP